jgi:hypothetical protein
MTIAAGCTSHPSPGRPAPTVSPSPTRATAATAPVLPCKNAGEPPPPGKVPGTVRLPREVELPGDASLRGMMVGRRDGPRPTFVIGAKGDPCQIGRGMTGGNFITVAPADGRSGVFETWSADGAVNPSFHGCAYIPQVAALATEEAGEGAPRCRRPPQHKVRTLRTGTHRLFAALVKAPRYASALWPLGEPRNDTYALFVSHIVTTNGRRTPFGQSLLCNVPQPQRQSCVASLTYFLLETTSSDLTPDARRRATSAIRSFVTG